MGYLFSACLSSSIVNMPIRRSIHIEIARCWTDMKWGKMRKGKSTGKRILGRILAGAAAMAGIMLGYMLPVRAAGTGQVQVSYTCSSGSQAIQGAEFSLVCVADAKVTGTGAVYTLCADFEKCGLDPQKPSFWSGKDTASELLKWRNQRETRNLRAAQTQSTDAAGNAHFTGLKPGIYLVWQSGADKGNMYEISAPLIVAVPTFGERDSQGNAAQEWHCIVFPKTTARPVQTVTVVEKLVETASTVISPQKETAQVLGVQVEDAEKEMAEPSERGGGTGDDGMLSLLLIGMLGSAAGLAGWLLRLKRHREG